MSKAFTRENDDFEQETTLSRATLPIGTPHYMTSDGAECLGRELAELLDRRRQVEGEATEHESEPRDELRRINARAQTISQILDDADIVSVVEEPAGEVRFGMYVTVRDAEGVEDKYRIAGVEEVDLEAENISWLSPLARALTGHKVGDVVRFQTPGGERKLRILRIQTP